MADLKFIGRILGLLGGLLMIIIGIIAAVNNLLEDVVFALDQFGIDLGMNFVGGAVGGDLQWVVTAAIMIICGLVAIFGFQQLAGKSKGDLLVWGIIYIVVGLVGLGLGGLLVFLGGIVLVIDNFI